MKSCPECSGRVPKTYEECPFCGYHFDRFSGEMSDGDFSADERDSFSDEEEDDSESSSDEESSGGLKKLLWEIKIFILALLAVGVIVLATDFKGARTELRRICMTDSGDGSGGDTQHIRIKVKYYILVILDLFDHGGTGESIRTNPNAFKAKPLPDQPTQKVVPELKEPAELPSPPPIEKFDFSDAKTPAAGEQPGDAASKNAKPEGQTVP